MIAQGKTRKGLSPAGWLGVLALAAAALPLLPGRAQTSEQPATEAETRAEAVDAAATDEATPAPRAAGAVDQAEERARAVDAADKAGEELLFLTVPKDAALDVVKPGEVPFLPRPSESERKILSALDEPTTLDFDEVPLSEVIEYLAGKHNFNVILARRPLEDAGLRAEDELVTIHLSDISLRSALRLLLEPRKLAYIVADDVMKITTEDDAEKTLITRVYPIGDLATQPGNDIDELIQSAIAPETWAPAGEGTIGVFPEGRSLVVRQSFPVHAELVHLLAMLRQAKAEAGGDEAAEARRPAGGVRGVGVRGGGLAALHDRREVAKGKSPELYAVTYDVADLTRKIADGKEVFDREPHKSLIVRIRAVAPASWSGRGGKGEILVFDSNDGLVIQQTKAVHDKIKELLQLLRRQRELSPELQEEARDES